MVKSLNLDNIRFVEAFSVDKKLAEDAVDPKGMIAHQQARRLTDLAMRISETKDIWVTEEDNDTIIYKAELYIFTPEELKQWKENIVALVKEGKA